jgi:hypothetical protein
MRGGHTSEAGIRGRRQDVTSGIHKEGARMQKRHALREMLETFLLNPVCADLVELKRERDIIVCFICAESCRAGAGNALDRNMMPLPVLSAQNLIELKRERDAISACPKRQTQ